MEVKIACPTCGHKFNLKAANPAALAGRTFTCPKCGASAPFGQLLQRAGIAVPPPPATPARGSQHPSTQLGGAHPRTNFGGQQGLQGGMGQSSRTLAHIGGNNSEIAAAQDMTGKTQYFGSTGGGSVGNAGVPPKKCYLVVRETGKAILLKPGQYILGRDSSDSGATMRIAPDRYMSRRHAHLSVTQGVDGILRLMITGMNSQNDIFINSCRLYPGATTPINPGDEILLGMTNIKYVVK